MSWQALAPLTPPAALMSETARPTPAISGGPRKARLPVSGRMPPTLKESALVAPAAHLSLVNAARRPPTRSSRTGLRRSSSRRRSRPSGVAVVAAGDQGQPQGGAQATVADQPLEPPGGGGGSIHVVNLSSRECTSPRPGPPNAGHSTATVISAAAAALPGTLSLANRYVNAPHGSEHDAFGLGEDYSHPGLSHVRRPRPRRAAARPAAPAAGRPPGSRGSGAAAAPRRPAAARRPR